MYFIVKGLKDAFFMPFSWLQMISWRDRHLANDNPEGPLTVSLIVKYPFFYDNITECQKTLPKRRPFVICWGKGLPILAAKVTFWFVKSQTGLPSTAFQKREYTRRKSAGVEKVGLHIIL